LGHYLCSMETRRKILLYKNFFLTFYRSLESGAQKKMDYVLDMLKVQERVSEKFVKSIRDGLYEIRVSYNGNIYRAFFIFDAGNIVMLFNGFQKKTQKTPLKEIAKALELKKEYYAAKK
jgi:phage-related protein